MLKITDTLLKQVEIVTGFSSNPNNVTDTDMLVEIVTGFSSLFQEQQRVLWASLPSHAPPSFPILAGVSPLVFPCPS
eukprot:3277152-Rhodomonas_salina.1